MFQTRWPQDLKYIPRVSPHLSNLALKLFAWITFTFSIAEVRSISSVGSETTRNRLTP